MTLDAGEFIRRFLLHVLPDGFHRIRLGETSRVAAQAREFEPVIALALVQPRDQFKIGDHGKRIEPAALERIEIEHGNAARVDSLSQFRRAPVRPCTRLHVPRQHFAACGGIAFGVKRERPAPLWCRRNFGDGLAEDSGFSCAPDQ
jgi:hypothetical protein